MVLNNCPLLCINGHCYKLFGLDLATRSLGEVIINIYAQSISKESFIRVSCTRSKNKWVCERSEWEVNCILYSGFYLRGPNFCKICEVLTSSQILILQLLFYFREPATEHVILASGYPRKTYKANKLQIAICLNKLWHVSYYCRAFTHSNSKGSWWFRVSWQQTSISPIPLDHAHLLINVVSSNNLYSTVNGHVLLLALIIEISISGWCVNWSGHTNHVMGRKFYNSKYYF